MPPRAVLGSGGLDGILHPGSCAALIVDPSEAAAFATIQSAIDAAVPEQDEIFVVCGTYPENIVTRDGVALPDIGARENEGVTGLRFEGGRLDWDPELRERQRFGLYRGDPDTLKLTGVYTQDP